MNKLFALLTALSIATHAGAEGPSYKDFLIKDQPPPATFFVQQDLNASCITLRPENSGLKSKTKHKRSLLDASPVLVINNKKSLGALGIGYVQDQLESLQSHQISSNYSGTYLHFFAIGEITPGQHASLYATYGSFSNDGAGKGSSGDKGVVYAINGYKRNPHEIYKLGFMFNTNFGENTFLPVLGLSYSNASFVFDILLPSHISIRSIYSDSIHIVAKAEFIYASYYDSSQKDSLEISGLDTSVMTELRVGKHGWLKLGLAYAGEKQLRWIDSDSEIAVVDATPKMFAGFEMRY